MPCEVHPPDLPPANRADRLLTCWNCYDRLRDMVDPTYAGDPDLRPPRPPSIPRLYARLSPFPAKGGSDDGRRPPGFGATSPINAHHVALRDPRSKANAQTWEGGDGRHHVEPPGLLHSGNVLGGWLSIVIEERPLSVPSRPWTVERIGEQLATVMDWCCAQGWIVDMASELRELQNQLRTALPGEGPAKPRPVGACREHVDGQECGGALWLRRGDNVVCSRCGAWWPRETWIDRLVG